MALMTADQFEESLKELKPRVFMNGKQVNNILENKNTRTVVEANKASYAWALAGDIGGGLIVTMPSLKELKNPEVKDYVKEFYSFGSDVPTESIMKVHKLLQHWSAGQHGVATWHGAGPVMANKIMLQRVIDCQRDKNIVKQTLDLN
jgi:4-hydroxybutyryl-CoA dehydratase/vinylacetyl-CoA-Delta-isomerase